MKFQEGDKIVVLATGEKGEVVEWINKKMLTIRVDGVDFPVYADQVDFPYYNDFSKPKEITTKKSAAGTFLPNREKKPEKFIEKDGVWLSFFPVLDKDVFDDDLISHFKIYLLNHMDEELECSFSVFLGQNKDLELKSVVRALDELYLIDLPLDKLSDHPKFIFEFKLTEKRANKANRFVIEYKPKGKQMFKLATQVIQQQQASFKHKLFDQFPLKGDEILQENPDDKEEEQHGIDLKKLMLAGFKVKKR